ncbi:MAG: HAMP domain-containing sensor histidine kinase, partial [Bacteroidales bacterium]
KDIEMIRELKTVRYKERTSDIFGYHEERAGADLVIICSATDLFGMKKLSRLRFILASVFLVSLVVVYFTGRQFASGALEPISQLVREVDQIDITRISSRITTRGDSDEIAQLTDTFNKMLARLDTAFKFQKIFIPNASHELLTPLTAITGQLEVALMKDRDVEEYKATLGSVLEDIKSLNELTNRLLILTRLGGEHTPDKFNLVRIDEILWNSRSELIKRNKQFNINIFFTDFIQGEHHLNSNGNPTLLKTAFMNIIENGCKYSSDHRTDIYLSVIENACEILFKDEGIGIPGEDLDYIFHPFYRGGNVKNNKGHGIGLSLVESVILLHHGTISVNSKLKTGTEVRITLPLN